ncbi:MAG: alpha/beta hydrolase [Promethearchaeia archaeon]
MRCKKIFLDDKRISEVVFFPRKIEEPSENENLKPFKVQVAENIDLGGILYLYKDEAPTILLFHGNGEISMDYQGLYPFFFKLGVNLAVIDFRGYGFSDGEPSYLNLIEDAYPAYKEFTKWKNGHNLENSSLFLEGRSLGSVCAAEIGSKNPEGLKGIIFESGFADTYNMMTTLFGLSGSNLSREKISPYSNLCRIKKITKPVLILHGSNDWIVPIKEGKKIYNVLPADIDKKFIEIKGANHNTMFSFQEKYFSALSNFVNRYN